jgi:hypothetical protein
MPAYATLAELRAYMDLPAGETVNDADLQRALDAGGAYIDWFTGRTFGLTAPAEARVWEATTTDVVPLVDLQTAAPTVAVDTAGDRTFATTLVAAQFSLEPYAGPPFDTLRAWPTPAGGDAAPDPVVFEPGQLVRVTGVYGFTDAAGGTPAEVEQANLLLGARWYKRREVPFSVLQAPELDAFQTVPRLDSDVVQLLFPLCRPGSPGAALMASQLAVAGGPYGAAWVMV